MASFFYDSFIDDVLKGNVVPSSDTFYMLLATSTYAPSKSAHAKRSDVTNEVTGTGYTAGGQAVTVTLTAASGNGDKELINLASVVWSTATITARYAVVYKHRGGASSADELVCLLDFGSDVTSTGANFTVTTSPQGGIQN